MVAPINEQTHTYKWVRWHTPGAGLYDCCTQLGCTSSGST